MLNLDNLTQEEKVELNQLLAELVWLPHPDNEPQIQAYFSPAFETLYGGAAGGGKSDLLLGLARTQHNRSLLLRREFPDLERSLISRSLEFFGDPTLYNATKHIWNVDGRRIEFGHMEQVGTPQVPKDEAQYASAPYDLIGFDQLEQFPEYAYIFMTSRARAINNRHVRIVATANPVGEYLEWIIKHWAPWLDPTHPKKAKQGELRWYKRDDKGFEIETNKDDPDAVSRTYIPAGLADNPYLGDDYRRQLNLLPEPLRSALLKGEWSAMMTDDAYQVIPRAWVKLAQNRWTEEAPDLPLVIGGDIAHGGEDQTVFAPRRGSWFDYLQKHSGHKTPTGSAACDLLELIIKDGWANLDVIGVGASAYDEAMRREMNVKAINFAESSSATDKSGKLHFLNKRAEFYWALRDALDPESGLDIALPPDPELEGDLCAPRWSSQTRGIKIEEKKEIKKRLGRSPDSGDAVVLAWAPSYNANDLIDFV